MPITEILSEDQRRKRVWRRVQYLLLITLILVVSLLLSLEFRSGYRQDYQNWIENYAEKLLDNYDPLLTNALQGKKTVKSKEPKSRNENAISIVMETLRKQPVVIEASLFDASGMPLARQIQVASPQILHHYNSSSPQIFIRELLNGSEENESLGYLRITLDRQFIIKQNIKIVESKWHLLLMIAAFCLLLGMSIGKRFTKWRPGA